MGTISSAFNIIAGALQADQSALNIVGNNVANANTVGYSEQTPTFTQNPSILVGDTYFGNGVSNSGYTTNFDSVLASRIDQQQQASSSSAARLSALNQIETLFTPSSGSSSSSAGDIGTDITNFFNSFTSLESNSTSLPLREQVLSSGSTLSADVSNAAKSLTSQQSGLDQQVSTIVTQVNSLTTQIAALNQQIGSSGSSTPPSALADERSQELSQLSKLIGINQVSTENNGLSITTTSGQLLVSQGTSVPMTAGLQNGVTHLYLGGTDVTASLTTGGGQLGGILTARDTDIPNALSQLDQLAYTVSTKVNALNNTGTDLNGATGSVASPLYIFNQPTTVAGSALSMAVTMTDPTQIAAAASGAGTGDNSNAASMAALASASIVNGETPSNFYASLISNIGSTVSSVTNANTAQTASVSQLQSQMSANSGVNLNDEASNLTTYERSYQAASQVFSILNSIMADTINLGERTTVS